MRLFNTALVVFLLFVSGYSAAETKVQNDNELSFEDQVAQMEAFVAKEGQWSELAGEKVHVSVHLIQFDKGKVAAELVKRGIIDGFVSFPFEAAYLSDVQVAIVEGDLDYFKAVLDKYPEKVNDLIKVSDAGDMVTILGLLSTNQHRDKIYYEGLVLAALKAGADPRKAIDKGVTPLVMASSLGNEKFIEIVGHYENSMPSPKTEEEFFKNPSLTTAEMFDEQGIIDAFIELRSEVNDSGYETKDLHQLWIKMISKGYNSMADMLYNVLKEREDFSIDMRNEKGLSGLIAAGMSRVYGGNVDYAKKLISYGADVHQVIQFGDGVDAYATNVIELALPRDNHKFVALMIKEQVNFLHSPNDRESLIIDMAINQKAYRSAFIIKTAIDEYVNRMEE
jgi:ankyrin repeat protein